MDRATESGEQIGQKSILGPGTEFWNWHPEGDHKLNIDIGMVPPNSAIEVLIRGQDDKYTNGPVLKVSSEDLNLITEIGTLKAGDIELGQGRLIWWYNK